MGVSSTMICFPFPRCFTRRRLRSISSGRSSVHSSSFGVHAARTSASVPVTMLKTPRRTQFFGGTGSWSNIVVSSTRFVRRKARSSAESNIVPSFRRLPWRKKVISTPMRMFNVKKRPMKMKATKYAATSGWLSVSGPRPGSVASIPWYMTVVHCSPIATTKRLNIASEKSSKLVSCRTHARWKACASCMRLLGGAGVAGMSSTVQFASMCERLNTEVSLEKPTHSDSSFTRGSLQA
mmetsp:Transcript_37648/g.116310  ORF Transcript_37648/g.116310 Transcript_37648/m.116310 type:complete len:237 (-) Transcript_37648:64-774(-)